MFEKRKAAKLAAAESRDAAQHMRFEVVKLPDSDGVISPGAFQELLQYGFDHHVDLAGIPDVWTALRLGLALGGYFLSTDTTLLLKGDERPLLDVQAHLLKEVTDREFRGGSRGVSVPLGGGVRYRTGAVRGHMVTIGTHWATADTGSLTLTDKRVVYHGGRKTIEFPFTKLSTLNTYTDAIDLGVTSRQNTSSFRVGDPELVAGLIRAAYEHQGSDLTIIRIDPV